MIPLTLTAAARQVEALATAEAAAQKRAWGAWLKSLDIDTLKRLVFLINQDQDRTPAEAAELESILATAPARRLTI